MSRHTNHQLIRELETEYETLESELLSLYDRKLCLEEGHEGSLLKRMNDIQDQIAKLAHHNK